MHTFEECKTKIEGIKKSLKRIKDNGRDYDIVYVAESAIVMCDELLREDVNGKEKPLSPFLSSLFCL